MDLEKFGRLLKRLREEEGLSITALAKKSDVSQPYISQLENGKRTPSPEVLGKLAFAFEMNLMTFRIATGITTIDEERERLIFRSEAKPLDLIDILESDNPLMYKGKHLNTGDKKRITDILEVLYRKN